MTTMGRDPIVAKASELMRLDIMPSFEDIKSGKVGLASLKSLALTFRTSWRSTWSRLKQTRRQVSYACSYISVSLVDVQA